MKHLLCIFANPMDESYLCAGTIVKYIKAGWSVDVVCAIGASADQKDGTAEQPDVSVNDELEEAAKLLGISSVTYLGYKKGSLPSDPVGELEAVLYDKLVETVPDIVITYHPNGIDNNPDNVRLSYSATFAFQKYARWIDESMKGIAEFSQTSAPKLYYACFPQSEVTYMQSKGVYPDESYAKPLRGVEDKFISAVIPTTGAQRIKRKAILTYESQADDMQAFLSMKHNPFMSQEYFVSRYNGTTETFMGKFDRIVSSL